MTWEKKAMIGMPTPYSEPSALSSLMCTGVRGIGGLLRVGLVGGVDVGADEVVGAGTDELTVGWCEAGAGCRLPGWAGVHAASAQPAAVSNAATDSAARGADLTW
jgi:hypothetical protein